MNSDKSLSYRAACYVKKRHISDNSWTNTKMEEAFVEGAREALNALWGDMKGVLPPFYRRLLQVKIEKLNK